MPTTSTIRDDLGAYTLAPTTGVGIEVINPVAQAENTFNLTKVPIGSQVLMVLPITK